MRYLRQSIKMKLVFLYVGIMLLILLLQCLANIFLLQHFYMSSKLDTLKNAYVKMNELVLDVEANGETLFSIVQDEFGQNLTDSKLVATMREMNDVSNINLVMIDGDNNGIVAASRDGEWLTKKLRFYLANKDDIINGIFPGFGLPISRSSDGNEAATGSDAPHYGDGGASNTEYGPKLLDEGDHYFIQETYDFRSDTSYLESWGFFDDGETRFLMSMPIASIKDSVGLANQFTLIVGAVLLVFGNVIIYFASSAFTKPIDRLADSAKRMTALDFSARYHGTSKDEIGSLGASMNAMSDTLERTIAELKTSNNKLQQDIDEKNKIDAMRKDFIANVSHELKTPIALIEGYAEGLTEGMAEDPDSRDYYCGVIMDEAIKMNRMIRQLTSLNNIEFGSDNTDFVRFDAAELLRSVAEAQRIACEEAGARLIVDVPKTAYVWADEFKIEEVVTNYLTNAMHHVAGEKRIIVSAAYETAAYETADAENKAEGEAAGGKLQDGRPRGDRLRDGKTQDNKAQDSNSQNGRRKSDEPVDARAKAGVGRILRITVYNDGNPIPEADLPHIWEKFYKVDKARTRAYGGSGIGLSIVKAIADSHHQKCGVENRPGGVAFWFTLDASEQEAAQETDQKAGQA